MISGATDTRADADKLHQGVIDEFKATILTGSNCTSVKVKINAKKNQSIQILYKTFQLQLIQV